MPYIEQDRRGSLERTLTFEVGSSCKHVGELTYVFYRIAMDYINSTDGHYTNHAEVIAALDNAKEEYRRLVLSPYEDAKREANGDVL